LSIWSFSNLVRRADRSVIAFIAIALAAIVLVSSPIPASAAGRLAELLQKAQPSELVQGADRFGQPQGDPPITPVYRGDELAGYVYLNTDFTSSVGYSGKPIHILVGIDPTGTIRGFKLVGHSEPIVLIGIPEERVVGALNSLIGKDLARVAAGAERHPQVDIVGGATVTVLVMGDSIVRSAVKLIRSGRLGGGVGAAAGISPPSVATRTLDLSRQEVRGWQSLVGDGSVRSLRLTVGEVTQAFRQAGQTEAANRPESRKPEDLFIELYIAPVSVPTIGVSLLGERGYERLRQKLKDGQQAILVAGDGAYSFKGSGYVRGGIFDRIELLQDGGGVRFRDRNHARIGDLAAEGAPRLREIALFTVPEDFNFSVTEPWELQLLVQRSFGARDKASLPFNVGTPFPSNMSW
jgi:NosR/NirI family nitrous oxide reductase transcriptional regulator